MITIEIAIFPRQVYRLRDPSEWDRKQSQRQNIGFQTLTYIDARMQNHHFPGDGWEGNLISQPEFRFLEAHGESKDRLLIYLSIFSHTLNFFKQFFHQKKFSQRVMEGGIGAY